MVRKLGPRFHRIGSLYPYKDTEEQKLFSLHFETISSTGSASSIGSNSSTVPNSPADSATIVGSPISTRANSPFEIEFNDTKSQDYFSEFTTLFSKSPSTSISSESADSSISTPDHYSTSSDLSTTCNNKYNLSSINLQKTCNNQVAKRKSSKNGTRKLKYEQIITFNDSVRINDMISEEPFTSPEIVPNVKSDHTYVEENVGLIDPPIYNQEQNPVHVVGDPNLWEVQTPYFTYENYNLPNGPLKDGGSGDVFLTDWIGQDFILDP
ncbi:hypothetical protein RclHR1_09960003 [Rhizophagus clarus]|uniref:Uncharacterized protein n=1 Tax=Rhizophagus clarus TaxID=94130 RepID=A0A2Z6SJJ5_9GLOM|nr:hypothetical protein RclHR1_09960003 [Rhizophagus clarus]GET02430.1 hypothetical protein GLOIN_2v1781122 [Rhizophagus clarus]